MPVTFLIWAPPYTHRSSGVRALYRLCHHLNKSGYPSAMLLRPPGQAMRPKASPPVPLRVRLAKAIRQPRRTAGRLWRRISGQGQTTAEPIPPHWLAPVHRGPVGDSIVIYPEIVSGNPFAARKVIRWALNVPGLLGGDPSFAADELVFYYDPQRRDDVSKAAAIGLGPERTLWLGLVDPAHIYPDPTVPRTIDCSFTHKGHALQGRFPLPERVQAVPLEGLTTSLAALGDTLRRTRTLYSYDHYSNLLREAVISGCRVQVVSDDGTWHDPQTCSCRSNILWPKGFEVTYATQFHSSAFVAGFIREVRRRWNVPGP